MERTPLLVMYENGESWYLQKSKPIAIFLKIDEVAVYVEDLPKLPWKEANRMCWEMEVANLYWQIPNTKQLQILLEYRSEVDCTLEMLNLPLLHNKWYWGCSKIDFDMRVGVDLSLEREVYIEECQYAFTRPFLRM